MGENFECESRFRLFRQCRRATLRVLRACTTAAYSRHHRHLAVNSRASNAIQFRLPASKRQAPPEQHQRGCNRLFRALAPTFVMSRSWPLFLLVLALAAVHAVAGLPRTRGYRSRREAAAAASQLADLVSTR